MKDSPIGNTAERQLKNAEAKGSDLTQWRLDISTLSERNARLFIGGGVILLRKLDNDPALWSVGPIPNN